MKRSKSIIIFFFLILLFTAGYSVFAQTDPGLEPISKEIELSSEDPRILAVRIIQIFLGFLGLVLLGLIIWGGYAWMTAAGDEDKVEKAKKILINAGIGSVIIIMSLSISQFILKKFVSEGIIGGAPGGIGGEFGPGGGIGAGAFLVRSISPDEGSVVIRNVAVKIDLNENIDPETFSQDDIEFFDITDGGEVLVQFSIKIPERNQSRLELRSNKPCDAPNENRFCFEGQRQFRIKILEGTFASKSGVRLSCLNNKCERHFSTNNLVDVRVPEVSITSPRNGAFVQGGLVPIAIRAVDDSGIAAVDVEVDGALIGSAVVEPFEVLWDASGAQIGSEHALRAFAFDLDDNTAESGEVKVRIRAPHCFDALKDEDEEGIDCGGADCGMCPGARCQNDGDCASGKCQDGQCVVWPIITNFSPPDGGAGTFVTIQGQFFGNDPGKVTFLGDVDDRGDDKVVLVPPRGCEGIDWWQDRQIVTVVPDGASDGPLKVENRLGFYDTTADERGPQGIFDLTNLVRPGLCSVNSLETGEAHGVVGEQVRALGINFGNAQGQSALNIGGRPALIEQWQNVNIQGRVPSVRTGTHQAQAIVNATASNTVAFTVESGAGVHAPVIINLDPNPVAPGGYLTIRGRNFGNMAGRVLFVRENGDEVLMEPVAPVCGDAWWKSDILIVRVPRTLQAGQEVSVIVERSDQRRSETAPLSIGGNPRPDVCAIIPDNGPAGIVIVKLVGQGFGRNSGKIVFTQDIDVIGGEGWSWTEKAVEAKVPFGAETGEVRLIDANGTISNPALFTVSACNPQDARSCGEGQVCCSDQSCRQAGQCGAAPPLRVYRWSFTTRAGGGQGDPCEVDNECGEGLVCDVRRNVCVPDPEDPNTCKVDEDCSEVCLGSRCVNNYCTPVVKNITPAHGKEGTWVSINGCFFGENKGQAVFLGTPIPEDNREAIYLDESLCGDTWTNETITVEVPNIRTADIQDDAKPGPLLILTKKLDQNGIPLGTRTPAFAVDDILMPGICRIDPPMGNDGSKAAVIGQNFGDSRPEDSWVSFHKFFAPQREIPMGGGGGAHESWSNNRIRVVVPDHLDSIKQDVLGGAAVAVNVRLLQGLQGAKESNTVPFYLPPFITKIEPDRGAPGAWATITGGNFGHSRFGRSLVAFSGAPEARLPEWCSNDDTWTPTQIVTATPPIFPSGPVFVRTGYGFETAPRDTKPFTVTDDPLGPGLCTLDPSKGSVGINIKLFGDKFKNQGAEDKTVFYNEQEGVIDAWQNTRIDAKVPMNTETGHVVVRKKSQQVVGRNCRGGVEIGEQCVGGVFEDVTRDIETASNPMVYEIEAGRPGAPCLDDGQCLFGQCEDGLCAEPDAEDFVQVRSIIPRGDNACPNTLIEVAFSGNVDRTTLTRENIMLFEDNGVDADGAPIRCPANTNSEADQEAGNPEPARFWCQVDITDPEIMVLEEDGQAVTRVSFARDRLLEPRRGYRLVLRGANEGGGSGIRTEQGLPFGAPNRGDDIIHEFGTRQNICLGDRVEFRPPSLLFTHHHEVKAARANLVSAEGDLLAAVPGYNWSWRFESLSPEITTVNQTAGSVAVIGITGVNGYGRIRATARIDEDNFSNPSTAGTELSGFLPVEVFICENLWSSGALYDRDFNFEIKYCRDRGGEEAVSLPDFTLTPRGAAPAGVRREYFLRNPANNDVIGIRIISNPRGVSPELWYREQDFEQGNPLSTTIQGYQALQEGRTVYINFANARNNNIYTNIFVFSYNDGASEDTLEVYRRLKANLRFNTNVAYEDLDKLARDTRRIADLIRIKDILGPYREAGALPQLQAGSYLKRMSVSAWPSWNENLGAALRTQLPSDPLNTFSECEPGQGGYDPATCWNENLSKFSCRTGSYVYAYFSSEPDRYTLFGSLEYTGEGGVTWRLEGNHVIARRPDICGIISPPSSCGCFNITP